MLYVNTAKAHRWMVDRGLLLPTVTKLSAGSNGKILTPEDLVKYKIATGQSFTLSGCGMIDAVDLGVMTREGQMQQLVKHPMLYVNTPKAHNWMVARGLQLPTRPNLIAGSNGKILTPEDLVKYKIATGQSFTLSGCGMIDAVDLGVMTREGQMQQLVSHARREAARWERTFAKDTPNQGRVHKWLTSPGTVAGPRENTTLRPWLARHARLRRMRYLGERKNSQ